MSPTINDCARDLELMMRDVRELVEIESPSGDLDGLATSAAALQRIISQHLGSSAQLLPSDAGPHVLWGSETPKVLLLGHHDTVHPRGSLAGWPFSVEADIARGPGIFDMLAGIVIAIHALRHLGAPDEVSMLWTSDEEVGSAASRGHIERIARSCHAVFVVEPASGDDGNLKLERKGTGMFELVIRGRAAHAGVEPEAGVNAVVELSHQIPEIIAIAKPEIGTTVTPTLVSGGTTENTVPDLVTLRVDVRVESLEEASRVTQELHSLTPVLTDSSLELNGAVGRPPMPASASAELFSRAQRVAQHLGMPKLEGVAIGGGSDGNFTAALGVPTLDGLGAVGANLHTTDEFIRIDRLAERTALLAGLIKTVLDD